MQMLLLLTVNIPFLLALKNRCASIAIHMIVSVFLLLETVT